MNNAVVPKEEPEIPDCYGIVVTLVTGKKIEMDIVFHKISEEFHVIDYISNEDVYGYIPLANVAHVEFDKRFSKIKALENKRLMEQNLEKAS